ncbi:MULTISPECIES: recombinase family protein [Vibrio]|uniref:recombinase family protein n=1 Tax=Vibrio TaxID=662 RepID=UPI000B5CEB84|nr:MULTISPECIES: recombinase family protein [Vibrio]HBV76934.1 recombinase family protein [Vibrio sp.]
MTTYIYARTSTKHQNVKQQSAELLKHYKADVVLEEQESGKDLVNRPVFSQLVDSLKSGDTVIVYDMSRVGRNTADAVGFLDKCKDLGVSLKVHDLGCGDVTNGIGKMIASIFASVAEMQREQILEKQAIGIERAQAEGKYKGKQVSPVTLKAVEEVKSLIETNKLPVSKACKLAGISRDTYYRLK